MRDRLSLPVATWPRICYGQARRATASPLSLGYEPYDVRLCRLGQSLVTALASADLGHEVIPGPVRLLRLSLSRRISCTNARAQISLPTCCFVLVIVAARPGHNNGEHLIRRSRQVIQDRPSPVVCWADIPQLSVPVCRCPVPWQQYWQQLRRRGIGVPDHGIR
jgi:hypothetical protein